MLIFQYCTVYTTLWCYTSIYLHSTLYIQAPWNYDKRIKAHVKLYLAFVSCPKEAFYTCVGDLLTDH
jgi:hypothetical protein